MSEPSVHIRSKQDKPIYKVITIGNPAVGKTSLIKKYVKHQIDNEYLPTVGASISKQPTVVNDNGAQVPIGLLIWDIAGQEQFHLLHKVYYKGSKGVVIVFDLTNPDSLASVKKWHDEIVANELGTIPCIMVGNKSDLSANIKITPDQIEQMKADTGIADYYETSALNGKNVVEFFTRLSERIHLKK